MRINTDVRLIRKWLRELDERLESSKSIGPLIWGLDKGECIMLIQQVLANLPSDLEQADRVLRDSERLLGGAQTEAQTTLEDAREEARRVIQEARQQAERILEEARLRQARMVEQTEVYRLAESQAREVVEKAKEHARQIRQGADQYAYDVLTQLENALAKIMGTVQNGKVYLEDHLEPPVGTKR